MFLGLRTVIYHVSNIDKAKKWYASASGTEPYFDQPYYVGFNIGGFELGLDPNSTGVVKGNNTVGYWGVANIEESLNHLLKLGAKRNTDVQDVGDGVKVATVEDPFGNILGLIENSHFSY